MGGNFLFWLLEGRQKSGQWSRFKCCLVKLICWRQNNTTHNPSLKWRYCTATMPASSARSLVFFYLLRNKLVLGLFWMCFKVRLSSLEEGFESSVTLDKHDCINDSNSVWIFSTYKDTKWRIRWPELQILHRRHNKRTETMNRCSSKLCDINHGTSEV